MSRLEEIKENVVVHTAISTGEAISFELDPEDYFYLKKQAERAENLENLRRGDLAKLGELADVINELRDEKNSYKQALELISGHDGYTFKDGVHMKTLPIIASEALNQSK
jgi:hypothetical protein